MAEKSAPNKQLEEEEFRHAADVLTDFNARMSPRQAAHFLGISASTVIGAIERGEIAYMVIGSRRKVTPAALAAWVENYLVIPPDPLPG